MYQPITIRRPASIHTDNVLPKIGAVVFVHTLCYGYTFGTIDRYAENPFYGQSGLCAYVVGRGWTEYIPVKKLAQHVACECADCEGIYPPWKMCPECGYCLSCCDCPTPDMDTDYPDDDHEYDAYKDDMAERAYLHRLGNGG